MALAFRSNDITINNTEGTSCLVTAPSGIVDDDILLFALERANVTGPVTNSGFTQLYNFIHDGGSTYFGWKRASSESGDYTPTWTGNSRNVGIMYAISGAVASGTPFTAGSIQSDVSAAPNPPAVDPGSSAARLAVVICGQEGKGDGRFTQSSGYTLPSSPSSNGGTTGGGAQTVHCGLGLWYLLYTGQTEDPAAAVSSVNDGWTAQTIIFDPIAVPDISDETQAAMQQPIIPTPGIIVPVPYF